MKYLVYEAQFEPRVRRRWWHSYRRARKLAEEAPLGNTQFYVSLTAAHEKNPNRPHWLKYLCGRLNGTVTSIVTTASFD